MVTLFNEYDLISFGGYLLSEQRTNSVLAAESDLAPEERLRNVYDADLANWLEFVKFQQDQMKKEQAGDKFEEIPDKE